MSSTFTMPLGPVHVALEEPVYFRLTVEGETFSSSAISFNVIIGLSDCLFLANSFLD